MKHISQMYFDRMSLKEIATDKKATLQIVAIMQLRLRDFLEIRTAEKTAKENDEIFAATGGIHIPLASLSNIAIKDFQQRLTINPRATYDKHIIPDPIICFQLSEKYIIIPRNFGHILYKNRIVYKYDTPSFLCSNVTFSGELGHIQKEACHNALRSLKQPPFACIVTLPCGFGKTVLALSLVQQFGYRTIVIVHKEFLLKQWKERISKFMPEATISIIQGNKPIKKDQDIYLGMLQTLCNRLSDKNNEITQIVSSCGLAIIDEAHHMAARSFSELFRILPCQFILGLTATPQRKDGTQNMLHMFMGDFAYKLDAMASNQLIQVRDIYFNSRCKNTAVLSSAAIQKQKTLLTKNMLRNKQIVALCGEYIKQNRQILCLSDRLAHLQSLKEIFDIDYPSFISSFYIGGQNKNDRENAEKKASMIFGTYAMAQEGLDIPRLDTLILATPASDIRQAVGRILRPCETKQTPIVVDIKDDSCLQFERQNEQRKTYLSSLTGSNERIQIDQSVQSFKRQRIS